MAPKIQTMIEYLELGGTAIRHVAPAFEVALGPSA